MQRRLAVALTLIVLVGGAAAVLFPSRQSIANLETYLAYYSAVLVASIGVWLFMPRRWRVYRYDNTAQVSFRALMLGLALITVLLAALYYPAKSIDSGLIGYGLATLLYWALLCAVFLVLHLTKNM
jgi:uncharacterized membrane protein